MRVSGWRRQLCFFLIFITLLTGMCLETDKADSSFASAKTGGKESAVFMLPELFEKQDFMIEEVQETYEVYSRTEETLCERGAYRSYRNACLFVPIDTLSGRTFVTLSQISRCISILHFSTETIIGYLHRQDGSKSGSFLI